MRILSPDNSCETIELIGGVFDGARLDAINDNRHVIVFSGGLINGYGFGNKICAYFRYCDTSKFIYKEIRLN